MAFSVTKCDVGGSTASGYHYEYLCESADDIADLPTGASSTEISRPAPGSLAFVETDSSARYILKNSREWGEYPMAGGGGSTGGGVLRVKLTYRDDLDAYIMDKTAREIINAVKAGEAVLTVDDQLDTSVPSEHDYIGIGIVTNIEYTGGAYSISDSTNASYTAATLDDYPVG